MTQLINDARAQPRTCGEAGDFSATTLVSWNTQLFEAASGHSQDMITNNFFSHTGSDGLEVGDRIRSTGYVASAWGENISAGRTTAKEVIDAWLDSPGHCANIMNPLFTEIGAAYARDENTDFVTYWTLDFATPR
ncbi:MAG: CAP domain-containing protein [Thiotrichales bacterium]